jgi:DNA-binding NarL/FixJ family response regulator
MTKIINIAIADEHLLLRQGIVALLKNQKNLKVLFDVNSGTELLENLKSTAPHIILWNIHAPVQEVYKTYTKIKTSYPNVKIILLSKNLNDSFIANLIMEGVAGFLPNDCTFQKLIKAIDKVHKKGRYIDPGITQALIDRLHRTSVKDLNKTQLQVIQLLYEEKTPEEISKLLFLSRRTIEWHKNQCYVKTQTKSILGLMKYAMASGLVG